MHSPMPGGRILPLMAMLFGWLVVSTLSSRPACAQDHLMSEPFESMIDHLRLFEGRIPPDQFFVPDTTIFVSPIPPTSAGDAYFSVPGKLLADYFNMATKTIPVYQTAIREYRFLVYHDSVLIGGLGNELDLLRRRSADASRIIALYEEEIARRNVIEKMYDSAIRRERRWRGVVVGIGVAVGATAGYKMLFKR